MVGAVKEKKQQSLDDFSAATFPGEDKCATVMADMLLIQQSDWIKSTRTGIQIGYDADGFTFEFARKDYEQGDWRILLNAALERVFRD